MPTCRICGHVYNDENKWRFLQSDIYWCPFCSSVYKVFNPLPLSWFSPEHNAEYVFEKQKSNYEKRKRTGFYKN